MYRKSALEKIASPDQLDKMVVITPSSIWIAIAGGVLIVAFALAWALLGSIPTKVDSSGMYISGDETVVVTSEVMNIVDEIKVESGDHVEKGDVLYTLETENMKDEKTEIESKLEAVNSVTFSSSNDAKITETQNLINIKAQAKAAGLNTAGVAYDAAKSEVNKAKKDWQKKKSYADNCKEAYNKAVLKYGEDSDQAAKAYAEYETALTKSATAEATYKSAEASLSSYKISSASGSAASDAQVNAYKEQFQAAKGAVVDELEDQIRSYKKQIEDGCVKAEFSGVIAGLNILEGTAVQQGTATMIIRRTGDISTESDCSSGIVECYVSVSEAGKIQSGMDVNVYPSCYDRQEYGYIEGVVESVDMTTATEAEIVDGLGDQAMAEAMLSSGPVVSLTCRLKSDKESVSGYKWSTRRGSQISLYENTFVTAEIITEEKKPIAMLIPYLKEKFEEMTDNEDIENSTTTGMLTRRTVA